MATQGNQILLQLPANAGQHEWHIVSVKTEWNAHITDRLEEGVRRVLEAQGIGMESLTVPGAVELPFAIQRHARSMARASAYIALGCVIRGETPHFDYVCQSVTQGITILNTHLDVPVIFGVLTVDNEAQAIDRLGGAHGHKGEEAAITAIKMILFNRSVADSRFG